MSMTETFTAGRASRSELRIGMGPPMPLRPDVLRVCAGNVDMAKEGEVPLEIVRKLKAALKDQGVPAELKTVEEVLEAATRFVEGDDPAEITGKPEGRGEVIAKAAQTFGVHAAKIPTDRATFISGALLDAGMRALTDTEKTELAIF